MEKLYYPQQEFLGDGEKLPIADDENIGQFLKTKLGSP